eukprot:4534609-Pleurochrysis_carterae.AAC.2
MVSRQQGRIYQGHLRNICAPAHDVILELLDEPNIPQYSTARDCARVSEDCARARAALNASSNACSHVRAWACPHRHVCSRIDENPRVCVCACTPFDACECVNAHERGRVRSNAYVRAYTTLMHVRAGSCALTRTFSPPPSKDSSLLPLQATPLLCSFSKAIWTNVQPSSSTCTWEKCAQASLCGLNNAGPALACSKPGGRVVA